MKLSTQNHFLSDYFGFERSIEILKDVGYDTVDMSLFCMSDNPKSIFLTPEYRNAAEKLKVIALCNFRHYVTAHFSVRAVN